MRASAKYFWIVGGLLLVQMAVGIATAHYGVEGTGFYGMPPRNGCPTRWPALGTSNSASSGLPHPGLPPECARDRSSPGASPGSREPGVNLLFGVESGRWGLDCRAGLRDSSGVRGAQNFWFGHRGFEYVVLGRFWQILSFAGLLLWLTPDAPLAPARPTEGARCGPATVGCLHAVGWRYCCLLWRGSDVGERNESGRGPSTGAGGWCYPGPIRAL